MYGRAFELADGTIVSPCEFCGCPVWPELLESHMCPGLSAALVDELDRRIYEGD